MDNTKHLTGFFFQQCSIFFFGNCPALKKRNGPSLELLIIVCACGHLQLVTHFQYSKNKLLLRYSTLFKQWHHWIPTDLLVNRF